MNFPINSLGMTKSKALPHGVNIPKGTKLKLECGCKYARSPKGSFMIKSCVAHTAGEIVSKLNVKELDYLGVALNDLVHVEKIQSPTLLKRV